MDNIIANLSRDEIKNIIKVFDVQIAIVLVLLVFVTRKFVAKVFLYGLL